MARSVTCDICKKPCDRIVGKLFFTPIGRSQTANSFHTRYSHHADVGQCCVDRLLKGFAFQERKTAQEYHQRGRVA